MLREVDLLERTPGEEFALAFRNRQPNVQIRASITTTSDYTGPGDPVLPIARRRKIFLQDLIRRVPVTTGLTPYIREISTLEEEGGASAVAEGTAKPEASIRFEGEEAQARTVAAWIPATATLLDDAPALAEWVDGRLTYMLRIREEQQVLNGDGTGTNLEGIRQSGIQTQSAQASKTKTITSALQKVLDVDGWPDAVVLAPSDWKDIFDLDPKFGSELREQFDLRVLPTRAMEPGKALIGAFFEGATILDRMSTTIRIATQNDEDFVENRVTIRAEQRENVATQVPAYFVEASF